MWDALKSLFSSSKFLLAISSIIAAALAKKGFDVSQETITPCLQVIAALILGRAYVDGKAAAATASLPSNPTSAFIASVSNK